MDSPPITIDVPASRGLRLFVTCRAVPHSARLAAGVRSVSVFLVNERDPDTEHGYRAIAFQAGLVRSETFSPPQSTTTSGWSASSWSSISHQGENASVASNCQSS